MNEKRLCTFFPNKNINNCEITRRNESIRFDFGSDFAGSSSCRVETDTVSIRFDSISDFFDFDSKDKRYKSF
jgi:hypothetical protein